MRNSIKKSERKIRSLTVSIITYKNYTILCLKLQADKITDAYNISNNDNWFSSGKSFNTPLSFIYSINVFETFPRVARSSLDKNGPSFLASTIFFSTLVHKLGTALNGAINVSPSITKLTASDLYRSIIPNLNPRSNISLANSSTVS